MTISEIQSILKEKNRPALRTLGQNFLLDNNFARWIARQAEVGPEDLAVEIGPGLGALTQPLLETGAEVWGLELDRDWAGWLPQRFENQKLRIWPGDALDFDPSLLWTGRRTVITGNLPYHCATALISHFSGMNCPAGRLVFMVQKEVAERLAAKPDSKDYGGYTVWLQHGWNIRLLQTIGPECFHPRPKVRSSVVQMERKPLHDIPRVRLSLLDQILRDGFGQRRKQLRNHLRFSKAQVADALRELGLREDARPADLCPAAWVDLCNLLDPNEREMAGSPEEVFDVVNIRDEVTAQARRSDVHKLGLRHRAIHILLRNQAGKMFLQRRSAWKEINPGLWDSAAAGHLASGESYDAAADRELFEELGIRTKLELLGKLPPSTATGNEFVSVYRATHEGPFQLEELEIACGAFFEPGQIMEWMDQNPDQFSPVLRECLALEERYNRH
jgi:16S rRNA (adenine1518-N6/adenine1519-N6)-dimethyltransferase